MIGLATKRALLCLFAALGGAGFFSFACSAGSPEVSKTSASQITNRQDNEAKAERCNRDAGRGEADHDPFDAGRGSDEVTCVDDADCDGDKICKVGLCTGMDHPCTLNAECKTGEVCRAGNCEDPN